MGASALPPRACPMTCRLEDREATMHDGMIKRKDHPASCLRDPFLNPGETYRIHCAGFCERFARFFPAQSRWRAQQHPPAAQMASTMQSVEPPPAGIGVAQELALDRLLTAGGGKGEGFLFIHWCRQFRVHPDAGPRHPHIPAPVGCDHLPDGHRFRAAAVHRKDGEEDRG